MRARDVNLKEAGAVERAVRTEWLLTNGLGGYAMGTIVGANTRRYHGLLIAAVAPPVRRVLALHSVIEQIILGEDVGGADDAPREVIDLATHQFGDDFVLHPGGHRLLARVEHRSSTDFIWHYRIARMTVRKHLSLLPNSNSVEIAYTFSNVAEPVTLRLRPLTPMRDFHALESERDAPPHVQRQGQSGLLISGDGLTMLLTAFGRWRGEPDWWRSFAYRCDRERGQAWREDVWSPGTVEISIPVTPKGAERTATLRAHVAMSGEQWFFHVPEPARPQPAPSAEPAAVGDEIRERLVSAASQFVVARRTSRGGGWATSVIAGYPWFADWGRDTMIALPGLMLCTGRLEEARSTLHLFARHIRHGLVPNHFDDYSGTAAHYNTVDASLWFVHAVHALWQALSLEGGDQGVGEAHSVVSAQHLKRGWIESRPVHTRRDPPPQEGGKTATDPELLGACRSIIAAYQQGTDFDIRMDDDGLITAGNPDTQLTWMDAKRDGVVFTPRHGKAVEINALWFNALHCLAEMTEDQRERDALRGLAQRVGESFHKSFWWDERGYLHDCLTRCGGSDATSRGDGFAPDGKLRPNQIFAVSLPFSPLPIPQQRAVVKIVGERLLTPFGLRTLERDDPMYRGRYEGDLFQRDAAYHQGTVWPWLIGPYCEALLRVNQFSDAAKGEMRRILQPLLGELDAAGPHDGCLNQIAEVYDGDAPHRPSGCPAQAWSVAEILRVVTMIDIESKVQSPKSKVQNAQNAADESPLR